VDGLKKVEVRRRFPYGTATDAKLFIYDTVLLQSVFDYATIEEVDICQDQKVRLNWTSPK